ncbi:hypothetical protein PR048_023124 [Dryococelus australis]|uniref:Uncharacterized protein n=1 Tax=Dryococelus australis TaxID=614101 RepID=A0ABQ9GTA8_9NEOP|nr:hypothetical protein PR048_023124 [Dryococelus australis]
MVWKILTIGPQGIWHFLENAGPIVAFHCDSRQPMRKPTRVKLGEFERHRNARVCETGHLRENSSTSGIVKHHSHSCTYWSLSCVFIGCCPTPGSYRIRKVFTCKSVIGSEACRAACSSPTKADRVQSPAGPLPDFRKRESCRTMPLVGGFSRALPFPSALHSAAAPLSPHFTFIGSQDLVVKSPQISQLNPNFVGELPTNRSKHLKMIFLLCADSLNTRRLLRTSIDPKPFWILPSFANFVVDSSFPSRDTLPLLLPSQPTRRSPKVATLEGTRHRIFYANHVSALSERLHSPPPPTPPPQFRKTRQVAANGTAEPANFANEALHKAGRADSIVLAALLFRRRNLRRVEMRGRERQFSQRERERERERERYRETITISRDTAEFTGNYHELPNRGLTRPLKTTRSKQGGACSIRGKKFKALEIQSHFERKLEPHKTANLRNSPATRWNTMSANQRLQLAQPIEHVSQHAAGNQTQGPSPEPRAANQRTSTAHINGTATLFPLSVHIGYSRCLKDTRYPRSGVALVLIDITGSLCKHSFDLPSPLSYNCSVLHFHSLARDAKQRARNDLKPTGRSSLIRSADFLPLGRDTGGQQASPRPARNYSL